MGISRHPRVLRGLGLTGLLILCGCGRDSVTAPERGLNGPVVLVGYFTDSTGRPAGTRVFAQADGVPVELVSNAGVVATTHTVNGRYAFSNLPSGTYKARAQVTYDLISETRMLTVNNAPVSVVDTLRLQSRGDLYPFPNPFRSSMFMTFIMPASVQASLRVLDRTGAPIRTLLEGRFPEGQNGMSWDGTDAHGAPVPAGFYWLTVDDGQTTRAQLVFRQ
jgi:hypothetical protein